MTIKEVEQLLEVPRATVRFYEKEGLINPQRSDNGYREYSEEEEQKGNRFLDIAKDVAHFEKATFLEHFGIADVNGNLAVSLPRAIWTIIITILIYGVVKCLLSGEWNMTVFADGVKLLLWMLGLHAVVGLPIYLIGKKHSKVEKHKDAVLFGAYMLLLIVLIVFVVILNALGLAD